MSPKKLALWFLIVSVAISAALGIIAILTGNFGEFEIRIVLTTLTISVASICALACGAKWESGGQKTMPAAGMVFALIAGLLVITGIWAEPDSKQYWKLAASMGVLAAATAHACLLSLARLAKRFSWARVLSLTAIYLLAFFIITSIYIEPESEFGFRLIGTTSILVAALTIMVPIFHRLSREDLNLVSEELATEKQVLVTNITCPQCGAPQKNSLTETECDRCGCRFVMKILVKGRRSYTSI